MDFNGTFFAAIISFLVFVFIMNKMLYEPVRKIVKERNDFINGNYNTANENNLKADELSKQSEEKILAAKEEARGEYNEILSQYKEKRAEIVKEAQDESHESLEQAFSDLANISNDAKENLKSKMTDLANDIVEKILGYRSEVSGFDNDKVNKILYQEEN